MRIVDPDTLEPLPPNTEGLLLVKGSNRMLGYLEQPERTAEVIRDGWYVTGDIALLDDEGFLQITDRLSRFSKIGGEMVPHLKVEEAIYRDRRWRGRGRRCSRRPARRAPGGALRAPGISPADLWQKLNATDLPRLWIPKRENIYPIDALPLLGTGKLDLRGVKTRAQALVGQAASLPRA